VNDAEAARWLLSAAAVRARAERLLARVEQGDSAHFIYRAGQLDATVRIVLETIRANYPSLAIPFHSRWRHFEAGGVDRVAQLPLAHDPAERARRGFDLAIVSVLLDAGAGADWRYCAADGKVYARSEGLGVASFEMFCGGLFAADAGEQVRCDAVKLANLDVDALARGMQVSPSNPLAGLEGRAALLRSLGTAMQRDARHFGNPARVGNLFDALAPMASNGALAAPKILATVLEALGPIWPGRHALDGVPLGDTWKHSAFASDDVGAGLVPLHKLSQWLTYSLIEPLEQAGIRVTDLDGLTGLAEYRNGGLMLDAGLLELRDPDLARHPLDVSSEPVVEWRSLTVVLLDRVAGGVRTALGMSAQQLPLARVLEGGTWAAGRRLAQAKRAGGAPPLTIISDGTVF
jgi:Protein of unknown function (DUF1688)